MKNIYQIENSLFISLTLFFSISLPLQKPKIKTKPALKRRFIVLSNRVKNFVSIEK